MQKWQALKERHPYTLHTRPSRTTRPRDKRGEPTDSPHAPAGLTGQAWRANWPPARPTGRTAPANRPNGSSMTCRARPCAPDHAERRRPKRQAWRANGLPARPRWPNGSSVASQQPPRTPVQPNCPGQQACAQDQAERPGPRRLAWRVSGLPARPCRPNGSSVASRQTPRTPDRTNCPGQPLSSDAVLKHQPTMCRGPALPPLASLQERLRRPSAHPPSRAAAEPTLVLCHCAHA